MSRIVLAAVLLALPAFAQTTTTVTTESQQPVAQPPPPPGTTVNVNPNDPPARTRVRVSDDASVEAAAPTGRSAAAIIATDALYGGVAGGLVGGGVTLIDQGNHWQRDIMVGAGIGILAGAAFGIYESTVQPPRITRAAADRDAAASERGIKLASVGTHF